MKENRFKELLRNLELLLEEEKKRGKFPSSKPSQDYDDEVYYLNALIKKMKRGIEKLERRDVAIVWGNYLGRGEKIRLFVTGPGKTFDLSFAEQLGKGLDELADELSGE